MARIALKLCLRVTSQLSTRQQRHATSLRPPTRAPTVPGIPLVQSKKHPPPHPKNYMQSQYPTTSQNATTEQNTPNLTLTRQYGLSHPDPSVPLLPADDAGASTTTEHNAAHAASLREGLSRSERRRLSSERGTSSSSPPSSGFNRIAEYENASTPPMRKNKEVGFEVIKKSRSPGDKSSPIQDLPNGMWR